METIEISADFEHSNPLSVGVGRVPIFPKVIDEHEIVYRVPQRPGHGAGDLLIIEPRG